MARRYLSLLLLLFCLVPATGAWAAPDTPANYTERLEQVVDLLDRSLATSDPALRDRYLDQASELLPPHHWVEGPFGETPVDHRYLRRGIEAGGQSRVDLEQARDIAVAQLDSARQAVGTMRRRTAGVDIEAEERSRILAEQTKNRARLMERFLDWLLRLFGTGSEQQADRAGTTTWAIGLAIGLSFIGIALLAYGLMSGRRPGRAASRSVSEEHRSVTPLELWQAAQSLSAEGDHLGALRQGYLALLRHWDEQGLLRYLPTLTNREHERQLRRTHPILAGRLSPLTTLVETRLYAGQSASAEDFAKGAAMIDNLWREGDALSKTPSTSTGSSRASLR